jgi:hypothetical protein
MPILRTAREAAMTYRCGIGPGLPLPEGPPMIMCDEPGCEERIIIGDFPPAWFLNRKAKRGWRVEPVGPDRRHDWCPKHVHCGQPDRGCCLHDANDRECRCKCPRCRTRK